MTFPACCQISWFVQWERGSLKWCWSSWSRIAKYHLQLNLLSAQISALRLRYSDSINWPLSRPQTVTTADFMTFFNRRPFFFFFFFTFHRWLRWLWLKFDPKLLEACSHCWLNSAARLVSQVENKFDPFASSNWFVIEFHLVRQSKELSRTRRAALFHFVLPG